VRHIVRLLLLLMATGAAAAQDPQQQPPDIQQPEQQQIEEFLRTRAENGESHASGARPELGPVVLDVAKNPDGTVSLVTVYGGGWGHNLGMSQYGAHGRGRQGRTFIEILKAYYTGVDVGSHPIDIGSQPGSGPPTLRQEFVALTQAGSKGPRTS
jgi:hypothetical protein